MYSGDTINTTARIETVAKEVDRHLVVSEDVLQRASLPSGLCAQSLGTYTLRGKERELELFAIEVASA